MKIKVFVIACMIMLFTGLQAQQEAHFTQYMDNTLFINPAYAGSKGNLNATALHREQWVGFSGRPRSTTFSLHSPLTLEGVGVGFTAINDIVGPLNQTMFYGDFSYTIRFRNTKGKLAFGLNGGINVVNNRTDDLFTLDGQDPNLMQNITNRVLPNFGMGIYYHSPQFFIGASSPKLMQQAYEGLGNAIEKRHYYFITGGVFDVARRWKLRPSTHFKFTQGAPLSIDLSVAGIYNERFWLGLMHRWADSFGGFVQFQITPQFKTGFAYDHTTTELAAYNNGTYEILLSYDFVFKKQGIKSPRWF